MDETTKKPVRKHWGNLTPEEHAELDKWWGKLQTLMRAKGFSEESIAYQGSTLSHDLVNWCFNRDMTPEEALYEIIHYA